MSKERLEEIEKNLDPLGYGMGGHLISVNDINWLVGYAKEQAERVQELEELLTQIKYDKEAHIALSEKYLKKQLQNKRYREALGFYAEPKNWLPQNEDALSLITMDYGNKARKVLEVNK